MKLHCARKGMGNEKPSRRVLKPGEWGGKPHGGFMKTTKCIDKLTSGEWEINDMRAYWRIRGSVQFRVWCNGSNANQYAALNPQQLSDQQWCVLVSLDKRFGNREDLPLRAQQLHQIMYQL